MHTSQNVWQPCDGDETSISPTFLWGYNEIYTDRALGIFYALRYIINLFSYALPFIENEKNDKMSKFYVVQNLLFLFNVFTWDY